MEGAGVVMVYVLLAFMH